MLFFTLKTIFISLLLIALIHYLYAFFKNTLTIPKVKDLVNKPAKRYGEMFDVINGKHEIHKHTQFMEKDDGGVIRRENILPQENTQNMQFELKNFLNDLKKPDANDRNANININDIKLKMNDNFPAANDMSGSYTPF